MSGETVYEIRITGILDAKWSAAFTPLSLISRQDDTILSGPIRDQSELFGILMKLRDMGLHLISVQSNPVPVPVVSTFPVLTTSRLVLREFSLQDAPAVFDIFHLEQINQWLETDTLQTIEQAEERVRSRMQLFHDRLGIRWAITLKEDPGRLIGSCGFFSVRRGTHTMEAGYELHPAYWYKGYMTEALQALLDYAFSEQAFRPVHRVEAIVAPGNIASIRLLEKFGFIREGLRREFGLWGGAYQDVFLYALLK
jgi:ribosomal-protein-alanine N-acetyltransferase